MLRVISSLFSTNITSLLRVDLDETFMTVSIREYNKRNWLKDRFTVAFIDGYRCSVGVVHLELEIRVIHAKLSEYSRIH